MNYKTLSPTAKIIKKHQIFATGQIMTAGEIYNIGIVVACDAKSADSTIQNLSAGIRAKGGAPSVFHMAYLGYLNKVNPLTAKYAQSFIKVASSNIEAIVKANMLDAVIIVSDCDITLTGTILGTLKINCPTLVISTGSHVSNTHLFNDDMTTDENIEKSGSCNNGSLQTFLSLLEKMDLTTKLYPSYSGAHHKSAYELGEKIVTYAEKLTLPRKLLTKEKFTAAITQTFETLHNKVDLSQIELVTSLLATNDQKLKPIDHKSIIELRGTAAEDEAIAQIGDNSPTQFSGSAWVYHSLEDADRALGNGSVKEGIVVLQNCAGINVSAIAHTISEMGMTEKIAIATDGVCENTATLVIQKITPASYENEAFANIQTGDALEINLAKGRFNTAVLSKDIKTRAKRNSPPKPVSYF